MKDTAKLSSDRGYLITKDVALYLGISKGFLYKLIKEDPTFPQGRYISNKTRIYKIEDLQNWIASKNNTSDTSAPVCAKNKTVPVFTV